ncbi:MAG: molybdenum cofactor biosynthesis protein MoaD [Deltaproteobacteria bacterium]|nr:MAG: molybdenum cofactor biosynthesis protein MoaD [Deltaproteobacteria bacterium]
MAHVHFTHHLRRFFPALGDPEPVDAATAAELVAALDARHPGLAAYLVDDAGRMRKHVNLFVDGEMVADRERLSDALSPTAEVYVIQALSGG